MYLARSIASVTAVAGEMGEGRIEEDEEEEGSRRVDSGWSRGSGNWRAGGRLRRHCSSW